MAGDGRVLSAGHAPPPPQAACEDVSAATRPSSVLARPGATARNAVREPDSFATAAPAPGLFALLSALVRARRGLPPRWRANGCVLTGTTGLLSDGVDASEPSRHLPAKFAAGSTREQERRTRSGGVFTTLRAPRTRGAQWAPTLPCY
jgi:hypothetical protein